jgi:hypothetical protein
MRPEGPEYGYIIEMRFQESSLYGQDKTKRAIEMTAL